MTGKHENTYVTHIIMYQKLCLKERFFLCRLDKKFVHVLSREEDMPNLYNNSY
jgi:hypothetical protein